MADRVLSALLQQPVEARLHRRWAESRHGRALPARGLAHAERRRRHRLAGGPGRNIAPPRIASALCVCRPATRVTRRGGRRTAEPGLTTYRGCVTALLRS